MLCKKLFWLVFFCTFFRKYSTNCGRIRCKTSRVHGMRTADCFNKDIKDVPKCLPSNIEVLDLSYNRIRKITKEDLQKYPNLLHLYLTDNLLVHLDDETFTDITDLVTLDISVNAITKIPPAILQLPSLRNLYVSQNVNINIAESIDEAKPILHSQLTKVDMSLITEEDNPADFPFFEEFPLIAFLNITGDYFTFISPRHFAGLCNLQILENANVTSDFLDNCDCWKINQWLTSRKVKFTPFLCTTKKQDDCINELIGEEDLKIFEECREKFYKIETSIFWRKYILIIVTAIFLVLMVIAAVLIRIWVKRYRARKYQSAKNNSIETNLCRKDDIHLLDIQKGSNLYS